MVEQRSERKLSAILAADVVGFSRLVGIDDEGTLSRLKELQRVLIDPKIDEHRGRIVKNTGDGAIVQFASVVDALRCAVEIQRQMRDRNAILPEEKRIELRIGINVGDVIVDSDDIHGDGVNLAVRLEGIADPGGIAISGFVREQIGNRLDVQFEDLGDQTLKNIDRPVHVYSVVLGEVVERPVTESALIQRPQKPEKPSIAVLPFDNRSGDSEQVYFSDGVTEDIITELSRFRSLFVVARNSSFAFRGKPINAEIGRRLGVKYLVEGSVRKYGDRVRITAELAEADSGHCLWAEHYDRDLAYIFNIQDEVIHSIVSTLVGRLETAEVERSRQRPGTHLLAYDCILRAKALMNASGGENNDAVRQLLERATKLDPNCGRALALLAMTYIFEWFRTEVAARLVKAYELARQSIAADNQDSWCHFALGFACLHLRKFDEAHLHYSRAVKLNPNDADITANMGEFLTYIGKPHEAIEWINRARRLNPFHPPSYWNDLSAAYYDAHHYREAVAALLQMPQPFRWHDVSLAAFYAQMGDVTSAQRHAKAVLERWPDFSSRRFVSGEPYQHESDIAHQIDGLRKAGLPE